MYKKHHWLMRSQTFYQLHLLMDKHSDEQTELIDTVAGGCKHSVVWRWATRDTWPRSPTFLVRRTVWRRSRRCSRLLEHQTILDDCHDAAERVQEMKDDGTNDVFVSDVIRTNELQAWFVVEHLVDTPLVRS